MPIYEYACASCEHQFETIQRASEERLRDCPECGEAALKKLLSVPVFRLKGSGWYETDFKTSDQRNVTDSSDGKDDRDKAANGKDSSATDAGGDSGASGKGRDNGKTPAKAEAAAGKASEGGSSKAAAKSTKPAKQG